MSGTEWAVVTGASAGIGADLARGLAARGYGLWLTARSADALEALAGELRAAHRVPVRVRPCDLADPAARDALVAELAAEPVAVLCANAGFPTCGPLSANDPVREAAQVQVNVVALHALTQALLPGMLARRRGRVLVTGSLAGHQPVPTAATYSATKAFANTFAEALHGELRGTGVSCTLLAPGPVRTGFYAVGGVPGLRDRRFLAWLTPRRVAEAGLRSMARGRRLVVPGPAAKVQYVLGRHTPRPLLQPVLRTVFLPLLRGARSTGRGGARTHTTADTTARSTAGTTTEDNGESRTWSSSTP
ncbi:SDR family NAD(P)-dependent oxidoreductase [Streptomyces flavofungini]|uniref:SDR family NAD(P)-dependent oxidoreductase n=1 Tax=Streptomyces flavofungini TaxID=68200 RepID=UPI0034DF2F38